MVPPSKKPATGELNIGSGPNGHAVVVLLDVVVDVAVVVVVAVRVVVVAVRVVVVVVGPTQVAWGAAVINCRVLPEVSGSTGPLLQISIVP